MSTTWQSIAVRKQAERASAIPESWRLKTLPAPSRTNVMDFPRECGLLTARELELTERYDATALVKMMAKGQIKAEEVVTAFCKRAAIVHQITNCITEPLFIQAIARARDLDLHLQTHSHPIGPLHGLPISLKDTFKILNTYASIGIASLATSPSTKNASLVELLLDAGAVIVAKTNVPQTLMALDSHNNLFGRTVNPWNRKLTPGGSSGGEGVMIAMRGSALGVGTDVGGSIRIPAFCMGVVGFKPSVGRVPFAGQESGGVDGGEEVGIKACAGPIGRSVGDCEFFMRVVGEMSGWRYDTDILPQTWGQQICPSERENGGRRVRVGVVRGDGVTALMPSVSRFMDEAVEVLRQSGRVEVVEMDIKVLMKQCQGLFNKLTGIDGGNRIFDLLEETGEPLSPWLQGRIRRGKKVDLDTLRSLHARRTRLMAQFLDIWKEDGGYWTGSSGKGLGEIDVLIAPVAPHTAPPVDAWNTASYTSSFVLLDYPAATLPVRQVKLKDLHGEIGGELLGSWDKANRKLWAETEKETWLGGWHCLQVVGRRREDRVVVEAMGVFDEVLKAGIGAEDRLAKAKL